MRIYFIGSTSVGKTTLARNIAKELKLPFLNEIARTILAEKELNLDSLRIDLDVVDDFQKEISERQMKEEKKFTSFVSDRSFDNLAYMAEHARLLSKIIHSKELQDYVNSLKEKDVVIFFVRPHSSTMKNDGVRESVNWENIIRIDSMIKFLLEMFDLNYIVINTDNMQERVKLVHSVIKLMK